MHLFISTSSDKHFESRTILGKRKQTVMSIDLLY